MESLWNDKEQQKNVIQKNNKMVQYMSVVCKYVK